eukprot:CAMPEP_0195610316 /NCGR_PEP_ID=MMETSP0815-20121206/9745_1 /TAXON_ID=97485 /ORGANISM="Prymnesium parvum, Strain Texoma1" /LENGTH=164 /DNA_ID=CAMNT_0040750299 /DNA_START=393 /DNA_END=883 /DNA_ORIENTATION=+
MFANRHALYKLLVQTQADQHRWRQATSLPRMAELLQKSIIVALSVSESVAAGVKRHGRDDDGIDARLSKPILELVCLRGARLWDSPIGSGERVEMGGAMHTKHAHIATLATFDPRDEDRLARLEQLEDQRGRLTLAARHREIHAHRTHGVELQHAVTRAPRCRV